MAVLDRFYCTCLKNDYAYKYQTDHLDMIIAVDWDVKPQTKTIHEHAFEEFKKNDKMQFSSISVICFILRLINVFFLYFRGLKYFSSS